MWYMQLIDYTGSVTFYNRSHDQKAHYFTQLIWADTSMVGCGRAKFEIIEMNVTADRLVCNFAPKGNIHGKPVYAIGFPATQCAQQTEADSTYPGLCQYIRNKNEGKFTIQRPPVSSLLRILNLSNSSVKQEIDPIRSNLTQIYYGKNKTSEQRNQKIRHVLLNNNTPGHSRMHHGYQTHTEHFDNMHKSNDEDFRKYDFTTETMTISTDTINDLRKYNIHNNRCTRKMGTGSNCCSTERSDTNNCHTYKCTRSKCPHITHFCQTTCPTYINMMEKPMHNVCPCNKQTTICQNPFSCNCNLNCQCLSTEICATTRCPNFRRSEDTMPEWPLKPTLNLYDIVPNLAPQNGDRKFSDSSSYYTRIFNTDIENYSNKQVYGRKLYQNHGHQKNLDGFLKLNNHPTPEQDYNIYDFLGPNQRKKRENINQITFKPFWQVDQFNNENTLNLKSIRYTTLANKKNKKTRRTATSIKSPAFTEAITIKLKELSTVKNEQGRVSEKYLSFDELMHIRKMSTLEIGYDARRKSNETNILREDKTTPAVTTIATIETPFARKKHCTRKLTCTWTAFTATGSDGNIILPGGGGNYGSKTPPGYVDGCSRTSTCTRDFQERNKISTIPDPTSVEPSPEDEDYCEKRSLYVYRRNSSD
ncbi:hypothetical protein K1T71_005674 [Dendrolimus kikuchii]|uniref:Uncharacterized protein n=1 Tax=Dendrolimus kikuchii TaxID=765133 RepID=A0ACC1D5A5_9NEOP|nr:hypothetical protein K1T71_005674 [Dendrolimus kikuchii]